jgi:hypothetical protein
LGVVILARASKGGVAKLNKKKGGGVLFSLKNKIFCVFLSFLHLKGIHMVVVMVVVLLLLLAFSDRTKSGRKEENR